MSDPAGVPSVLVVDDDPFSLRLLADVVRSLGCASVQEFPRAAALLRAARAEPPDLVMTDIQMPEMNGIELVAALRALDEGPPVPIIAVTASADRETRRLALRAGVTDFLTKPIDPEETRARLRNLLALGRAQRALADRAAWLAEEVRRATATVMARERETIMRLARAAEVRDWETGAHIVRIAEYVRVIARQLGLPDGEQEDLWLAAPLHDVGKIGVPDYILRKPSRLSPDEFAVMQQHTELGHQLLHDSPSHLLKLGAEIALTHHERYDGTGYPRRLAGSGIPMSGRITAVADVFDALTSSRPYKHPWPRDEARAMLLRGAGTEFDPEVVTAFITEWPAVMDVAERWSDESLRERAAGGVA